MGTGKMKEINISLLSTRDYKNPGAGVAETPLRIPEREGTGFRLPPHPKLHPFSELESDQGLPFCLKNERPSPDPVD